MPAPAPLPPQAAACRCPRWRGWARCARCATWPWWRTATPLRSCPGGRARRRSTRSTDRKQWRTGCSRWRCPPCPPSRTSRSSTSSTPAPSCTAACRQAGAAGRRRAVQRCGPQAHSRAPPRCAAVRLPGAVHALPRTSAAPAVLAPAGGPGRRAGVLPVRAAAAGGGRGGRRLLPGAAPHGRRRRRPGPGARGGAEAGPASGGAVSVRVQPL